jgi:hypothetical protein
MFFWEFSCSFVRDLNTTPPFLMLFTGGLPAKLQSTIDLTCDMINNETITLHILYMMLRYDFVTISITRFTAKVIDHFSALAYSAIGAPPAGANSRRSAWPSTFRRYLTSTARLAGSLQRFRTYLRTQAGSVITITRRLGNRLATLAAIAAG